MFSFAPTIARKRPTPVDGLARITASSLAAGTLRRGPDVARFESALSERLGGAAVVTTGSGRLALVLALDALEVPRGREILIAAYNASCVPNVLQAAGWVPRFVDVRPDTFHLDLDQLPEPTDASLENVGALVVTHMEGVPAPVDAYRAWADARGVPLIEDGAHAFGALLNGRPTGTFGDAALFSLGRGKHLNTLGGGLAVTTRREVAARLRAAVDGLPPPPAVDLTGQALMEGLIETGTMPSVFGRIAMPAIRLSSRFGYDPMSALFEDDKSALATLPEDLRRRLSNLQARFGLSALETFDHGLARRRRNARHLRDGLADLLTLQAAPPGTDPAWLELTALVDDRPAFQKALLKRGVDTQRTWMDACDALPAFASSPGGPCPVARDLGERAVYLPTYVSLTRTQLDHLIASVREVLA